MCFVFKDETASNATTVYCVSEKPINVEPSLRDWKYVEELFVLGLDGTAELLALLAALALMLSLFRLLNTFDH